MSESMPPNYQLRAESEVAHCTLSLAMLRLLHSVTNEELYKKTSIKKIQGGKLREAISRCRK